MFKAGMTLRGSADVTPCSAPFRIKRPGVVMIGAFRWRRALGIVYTFTSRLRAKGLIGASLSRSRAPHIEAG
jgi:hypothetical protein